MPNILHRFSIDAPLERVQELTATKDGLEQWWTGRPVTGDEQVRGRLSVYFGDASSPAATFELIERGPRQVVWRCVGGPAAWIETDIGFAFTPRADGGITLLFSHKGWSQESEFIHGCSTNWGAYLMSLKSGAEGRGFHPFPEGELSRWD